MTILSFVLFLYNVEVNYFVDSSRFFHIYNSQWKTGLGIQVKITFLRLKATESIYLIEVLWIANRLSTTSVKH